MGVDADKIQSLCQDISKELENCRLCPRNCGVNRLKGEKGFCGISGSGVIIREMINNYEESCLNPSHQVYFAGCNLRCSYCSVVNFNLNVPENGISIKKIAAAVKQQEESTSSLNLLGGEPAVNIGAIAEFLSCENFKNPVVWNSNMYYNSIVADVSSEFTDIYLADFKCWDVKCCTNILQAGDYRKVAIERIKQAAKRRRTIIRHLIMPGHIDCCFKPIVEWLKNELPDVELSPRYNFTPFPERDNCPEGYLSNEEKKEAKKIITNKRMNIIT
jgi:putative pyruvate formate lyase activating enzyme